MFIVVDGMNGTGKTQALLEIEARLKTNKNVVFTEDPGGSTLGMELKRMMGDRALLNPYTRLYMHCAARIELCDRVIRPALELGKTVVSDRYYASNYAYQGKGAGLTTSQVARIVHNNSMVEPDMFIILDCHPAIAMARVNKRGQLGETGIPRKEHISQDINQNLAYFRRVRKGFLQFGKLARANGHEVRIVNAGLPLSSVVDVIMKHLTTLVPSITKSEHPE